MGILFTAEAEETKPSSYVQPQTRGTAMNYNADKRIIVAATTVAITVLLGTGIGYRAVARHLARPSDSPRMPRGTLDRNMPIQIGNWTGRDQRLDEYVIRATDTDDHLNRVYTRRTGNAVVGLFIAYGVQTRDLMPHRPDVCYPGGGWTREQRNKVQLTLNDGSKLECIIYRFSRAGFTSHAMTVLNYYIVDGEYCPDISEIRKKAWWGSSGISYLAQVQITCPETDLLGAESALRSVRTFAADIGPVIVKLFREVRSDSSAGQAIASPAEKEASGADG